MNITKQFTPLLIAIVTVLVSLIALPAIVSAQDKNSVCSGSNLSLNIKDKNACADKDRNGDGVVNGSDSAESRLDGTVGAVINILSVIVGIVAVIMIILGGFNYITSGGDSGKISSAKNTIIYAIVGLIIVALAQVIVRFVLSKV